MLLEIGIVTSHPVLKSIIVSCIMIKGSYSMTVNFTYWNDNATNIVRHICTAQH